MTASNCLLSALVLATATISGATTLYWDADGDASNNALDGTGLGGAGAWTTSGCWWDGASASNQDWVDGSEAVFAGTTGTVTVASAVTCSLRFDAAGYVVQANNKLTVTDAAGAAATLNGKPVDFENEVDVAWPGKVSGGSGTSFEKGGAGALSIGLVSVEGTYASVTIKKDAGTVTYTSPDAGGVNHTYFRMKENTRLDVGARTINFRLVEMDKTAVIESSSGGSIACNSQYDNKSVSGTLRGNLSIRVNTSVNSDRTFSISGDNTHTGGFLAPGGNRWNSAGPVYVDSDTGLGTGPVAFVETDTRSAIYLRFRSTSPSIGSLESSYRSEKNRWIHLGRKDAPVNNTELSIGALGTDTVYHDLIADYAEDGATGSVHKVGSGRIVFTAPLTYHGRTTVSDGTLLTVHNEGFSSGTLKYTCVEGSPDITITAGGADALAVGQVVTCDWGFNPKDNLVLAIDGNVATLDHAATGTTTQNKNLAAKTCTATIGNDVLVDGGTFAGSGRVVYDLSAGSRPMVLTSGVLDISGMTLEFTGTPANHSYVVVDYSAGGTFIGADNDATLDTFAAVENIPGEFRWRHFRDSKQVVLYFPPPATLLLIY